MKSIDRPTRKQKESSEYWKMRNRVEASRDAKKKTRRQMAKRSRRINIH